MTRPGKPPPSFPRWDLLTAQALPADSLSSGDENRLGWPLIRRHAAMMLVSAAPQAATVPRLAPSSSSSCSSSSSSVSPPSCEDGDAHGLGTKGGVRRPRGRSDPRGNSDLLLRTAERASLSILGRDGYRDKYRKEGPSAPNPFISWKQRLDPPPRSPVKARKVPLMRSFCLAEVGTTLPLGLKKKIVAFEDACGQAHQDYKKCSSSKPQSHHILSFF